VAFPECIIEQSSAAQIISAPSLALSWEVRRHQTCLTADEIVAISSVAAVVIGTKT
jgi:hypothetical protein